MIFSKLCQKLAWPRWLGVLIFLALGFRLVPALIFENMLWPDELYQTIEQAHRLVFGVGIIPWEFRDGLRSYVFPGFLALFLLPFRFFQPSSSLYYIVFVKTILSLLSCSLILSAYYYGKKFGWRYAGFLGVFFLGFWYEFIYFAPKAIDSVVATYLLIPGLFLADWSLRSKDKRWVILSTCLLAVGTTFRMHYLILWLVPLLFFLWTSWRSKQLSWLLYFVMPALIIFIGYGLVDLYTLGSFFSSFMTNVRMNLLEGVSRRWGVMPFFWYLEILWRTLGLFLPLALIGLLVTFKRAKVLASSLIAVFLIHSFIGHKEYRFIFVVLPALFIFLALGFDWFLQKIKLFSISQVKIKIFLLFFLAFSVFQAFDYRLDKVGYDLGRGSLWRAFEDNFVVYRYLSSLDDVWGIQDNGSMMGWPWSGGYYYLHHNVPIYDFDNKNDIYQNKVANYVVTRDKIDSSKVKLVKRINDFYIYKKILITKRLLDPDYSTNR